MGKPRKVVVGVSPIYAAVFKYFVIAIPFLWYALGFTYFTDDAPRLRDFVLTIVILSPIYLLLIWTISRFKTNLTVFVIVAIIAYLLLFSGILGTMLGIISSFF